MLTVIYTQRKNYVR